MAYKNIQDLYENQKNRWIERKVKAVAYKGGICVDCKQTFHPKIYHFHHRDKSAKEFGWTKLRLRNWESILKELDKCDLLCPNCHAHRHLSY